MKLPEIVKDVRKAVKKAVKERPTRLKRIHKGALLVQAVGSALYSAGETIEHVAEAGLRVTGQWDEDEEDD